MIWKNVLILFSLFANLLALAMPGLLSIIFAWPSVLSLSMLVGIVMVLIALTNIACTVRVWVFDEPLSAPMIRFVYKINFAVALFGLVLALFWEGSFVFVVYALVAAITVVALQRGHRGAWRRERCTVCGDSPCGPPSSVCPECGNDSTNRPDDAEVGKIG